MNRRFLIGLAVTVLAFAAPNMTVASAATLPAPGYLHQSTPAPTNSTIDIGWNGVSGATGYQVTRSGSPGYTGSATGTHFQFTLLSPGTAYTLTVATKNASGVGPASSITISTTGTSGGAPTIAPTVSQSTPAPTNSTIDIAWTAVPGATSYNVSRSGSPAYSTTTAGTHFQFTLLNQATAYTLSVAAVNAAGTGPTGSATISTTGGTPPPPTVNPIVLGAQYPGHVGAGRASGQVAVKFACPAGTSYIASASLYQSQTGAGAGSDGVSDFNGDRPGTCTGSTQIEEVGVVDSSGWYGGTEVPFTNGPATAVGYLQLGTGPWSNGQSPTTAVYIF